MRHGVTAHTVEKRFSGGLASSNPGLSEEGRDQVRATADWLAPLAEEIAAVVASPVQRTWESGEILAERFGHRVEVRPGFAEMEFGVWDGLTFGEVAERHRDDLDAWLGSLDVVPGGHCESFRVVEAGTRWAPAPDRPLRRSHGGRGQPRDPDQDAGGARTRGPLLQAVFRMELGAGLGHGGDLVVHRGCRRHRPRWRASG